MQFLKVCSDWSSVSICWVDPTDIKKSLFGALKLYKEQRAKNNEIKELKNEVEDIKNMLSEILSKLEK